MAEGREQPAFDFSQVAKCRIHPGIGIARVGNSPDEFFIGPEAPCDPNDVKPPAGGFKDAHGRIKRQAARFRIYAYDSKGKNLGELPLAGQGGAQTAPKAQVVWRVHLANKKGAWLKFVSRFRFENEANRKPRNPFVPMPAEGMPDDRDTLVVDPGPRKISGQGEPVKNGKAPPSRHFDTGSFLGTQVPLGEIKTDEAGRLLVLGGFGKSGSTLPGNPIRLRNSTTTSPTTTTGTTTSRTVPSPPPSRCPMARRSRSTARPMPAGQSSPRPNMRRASTRSSRCTTSSAIRPSRPTG
jgi:hypothetical protein